jgi:uncharacterized protein (TIGR03435 family)
MHGIEPVKTAGHVVAAVLTALVAVEVPRRVAAQERPAFEAATVKLAAADAIRNQVLHPSPNRLSIPSMRLTSLIYAAYGNGSFNTAMRVTGGPDWANQTEFAVEGVASGNATPRRLRLMLQTLLEERFALELRHTTETNDVLTLVVDRSDGALGPKVSKWDGTCPPVMPALRFMGSGLVFNRF